MLYRKSLALLLVSAIIVSSALFSEPVSIEKAKIVAINHFSERTGLSPEGFKIENVLIDERSPDTLFYIINTGDPQAGFVIVSADDATVPVLGYVFHQKFKATGQYPQQFDEMLESFRKQILVAKKNVVVVSTINGCFSSQNAPILEKIEGYVCTRCL